MGTVDKWLHPDSFSESPAYASWEQAISNTTKRLKDLLESKKKEWFTDASHDQVPFAYAMPLRMTSLAASTIALRRRD